MFNIFFILYIIYKMNLDIDINKVTKTIDDHISKITSIKNKKNICIEEVNKLNEKIKEIKLLTTSNNTEVLQIKDQLENKEKSLKDNIQKLKAIEKEIKIYKQKSYLKKIIDEINEIIDTANINLNNIKNFNNITNFNHNNIEYNNIIDNVIKLDEELKELNEIKELFSINLVTKNFDEISKKCKNKEELIKKVKNVNDNTIKEYLETNKSQSDKDKIVELYTLILKFINEFDLCKIRQLINLINNKFIILQKLEQDKEQELNSKNIQEIIDEICEQIIIPDKKLFNSITDTRSKLKEQNIYENAIEDFFNTEIKLHNEIINELIEKISIPLSKPQEIFDYNKIIIFITEKLDLIIEKCKIKNEIIKQANEEALITINEATEARNKAIETRNETHKTKNKAHKASEISANTYILLAILDNITNEESVNVFNNNLNEIEKNKNLLLEVNEELQEKEKEEEKQELLANTKEYIAQLKIYKVKYINELNYCRIKELIEELIEEKDKKLSEKFDELKIYVEKNVLTNSFYENLVKIINIKEPFETNNKQQIIENLEKYMLNENTDIIFKKNIFNFLLLFKDPIDFKKIKIKLDEIYKIISTVEENNKNNFKNTLSKILNIKDEVLDKEVNEFLYLMNKEIKDELNDINNELKLELNDYLKLLELVKKKVSIISEKCNNKEKILEKIDEEITNKNDEKQKIATKLYHDEREKEEEEEKNKFNIIPGFNTQYKKNKEILDNSINIGKNELELALNIEQLAKDKKKFIEELDYCKIQDLIEEIEILIKAKSKEEEKEKEIQQNIKTIHKIINIANINLKNKIKTIHKWPEFVSSNYNKINTDFELHEQIVNENSPTELIKLLEKLKINQKCINQDKEIELDKAEEELILAEKNYKDSNDEYEKLVNDRYFNNDKYMSNLKTKRFDSEHKKKITPYKIEYIKELDYCKIQELMQEIIEEIEQKKNPKSKEEENKKKIEKKIEKKIKTIHKIINIANKNLISYIKKEITEMTVGIEKDKVKYYQINDNEVKDLNQQMENDFEKSIDDYINNEIKNLDSKLYKKIEEELTTIINKINTDFELHEQIVNEKSPTELIKFIDEINQKCINQEEELIIAKKKLTEAKILFNEAITYKQDTKSFYNEINYHNINITEKIIKKNSYNKAKKSYSYAERELSLKKYKLKYINELDYCTIKKLIEEIELIINEN